MTLTKNENFLDRTLSSEMTRRKFMKVSGKSIVGVAISTSMLSLFGCTQEQVATGNVKVWNTPQGLLVVNEAKCVGCQRCEINCTQVNDGYVSSYISRVKVTRNLTLSKHGNGIFTEDNRWVYYPDTCRQCEDPNCGNSCPVKAISSDDKGVKKVDQSICVGCGTCTAVCPWNMPTVNPETKKSSKCIQCGACAAGCPAGALSIIAWDEVTAALQKTRV